VLTILKCQYNNYRDYNSYRNISRFAYGAYEHKREDSVLGVVMLQVFQSNDIIKQNSVGETWHISIIGAAGASQILPIDYSNGGLLSSSCNFPDEG
jgi:hypothetical protein